MVVFYLKQHWLTINTTLLNRFDTLVSRYEDIERKRDAVVEQIDQIIIRRRKIERFTEAMKNLQELITEFDTST